MKNRWRQPLIIAAVILLSACGYHFAGSGKFPGGVKRIFIDMLQNRSSDTGVESTFTNNLIYEFTRRREAAVAEDRAAADAILSGTIVSLSVDNVSRASISTALERQVTGVLNLRLESLDGSVLWASGNIVERKSYLVVDGNKTATDQNKSDAIAELSRRLAEAAFSRLTDNF